MEPRITRGAGLRLADEAVHRDAERHLSPSLLNGLQSGPGARSEFHPQPGEWEPLVGLVPDRRSYLEYGYQVLVPDEGAVTVCRVLVDRREPGRVVCVDWRPERIDSRKRPD